MCFTVLESFYKAISFQKTDRIPVVLWNMAPYCTSFKGVSAKKYYHNMEVKFKTQIWLQKQFPEALLIPGIAPDFGSALETSGLGCPICWFDDTGPHAKEGLCSYQEINHLKPINFKEDGLFPKALAEWSYLVNNIDPDLVDKYGYVQGAANTVGPGELAAIFLGYQRYLMGVVIEPKLMHKLINYVTEIIIGWLLEQEKVTGKLKRIYFIDHMPGQMSRLHLEEFWLPYVQKICAHFSDAVIIYHNENDVSAYIDLIGECGFDVWHFGVDLAQTKKILGNKVALMGNLHPVKTLLNSNPDNVLTEAEECLRIGAPEGGFLLASGGGMAPNTPIENIKAMFKASEDFGNK